MTVYVRFICGEIVGEARRGKYEVPEPSDVAALMAQAAAENGTFIENYQDYLIYLINGAPAKDTASLRDGDQLTVLRKVHGG